jgi:hypothetical protein
MKIPCGFCDGLVDVVDVDCGVYVQIRCFNCGVTVNGDNVDEAFNFFYYHKPDGWNSTVIVYNEVGL